MPKVQYPPQGGEKHLCLSLFCTMMLSVLSTVAIIYAIVIVYAPAIQELESSLEGPKMCTTLSKEGNLSGDVCEWHSCEEWCLSVSTKSCSHVWAAVRELGTTVYWDGCDLLEKNVTEKNATDSGSRHLPSPDRTYIDHTCNTLEDLEELDCKRFSYEKGQPGDKERCIKFNEIIISCESGVCKNVSDVYNCTYNSRLQDIFMAEDGRGECNCAHCDTEVARNFTQKYHGNCPDEVDICYGGNETSWNKTMIKTCKGVKCFECKDICHQRRECFDLASRRDPSQLGLDDYKQPLLIYYYCKKGYCEEIYDLKCERKCDSMVFNTTDKNSMLFIGERIIMAQCSKRSTVNVSSLDIGSRSNTLMVACTNVTMDKEAGTMISQDCVNGTWFDDDFNDGSTNYTYLTQAYWGMRDVEERRVAGIDYEQDITIYNKTKLKINIEGCVNTLSMECMDFYYRFGKDGRNYTARAVYPCYYDPDNPAFAVIHFNPDQTLIFLIFFVTIPIGIMLVTCSYMCFCSRFIHVADDGHMRLRCCGKYVTGIGNVPRWDPPRKKERPLIVTEEADADADGDAVSRDPAAADAVDT